MLISVSLVLAMFSVSYAFITNYRVLLAVVFVHGLFWSGLLAASGAYMTATVPESAARGRLGLLGTVVSDRTGDRAAVRVLDLQLRLVRDVSRGGRAEPADGRSSRGGCPTIAWRRRPCRRGQPALGDLVEWRVLALSVAMALIAFGYGSLTSFSALFADELGISPRSLFLTVMACTILVGRISVGRFLDRIGHRAGTASVSGSHGAGDGPARPGARAR